MSTKPRNSRPDQFHVVVRVTPLADSLIRAVVTAERVMALLPADHPLDALNQAYANLNHAHNCLYLYIAKLESSTPAPRTIVRRF